MKNKVFLLFFVGLLHIYHCYGARGYSDNQVQNVTTDLMALYTQNPPLPPLTLRQQTLNLLSLGAEINEPGDILTGYTALMAAVANPAIDASLIAFLINNGAATGGRQNYAGETVLTIAARADRSPDIIKLLLDLGSDPFHIDRLGNLDMHGDVLGNTPINYMLANAKIHQDVGDSVAYDQTLQSIRYLMWILSLKTALADKENVYHMLTTVGTYGPNLPNTTLAWLAYLGDLALLQEFLAYFGRLIGPAINQAPYGLTALNWASNSQTLRQLRANGATM